MVLVKPPQETSLMSIQGHTPSLVLYAYTVVYSYTAKVCVGAHEHIRPYGRCPCTPPPVVKGGHGKRNMLLNCITPLCEIHFLLWWCNETIVNCLGFCDMFHSR